MINEFLNLVYPNLCPLCSEVLTSTSLKWCLTCDLSLPKTYFDVSHCPMHKALGHQFPITYGCAPYYFKKGNKLQRLLHNLKYRGQSEIGGQLGMKIAEQLISSIDVNDLDFFVPVPLHPSKLLLRGYNQSQKIAESIARQLEKPVCDKLLYRKLSTGTQTKKSRYNRWASIENEFDLYEPDRT